MDYFLIMGGGEGGGGGGQDFHILPKSNCLKYGVDSRYGWYIGEILVDFR